jgi:hypothetical protein
MKTEHESSRDPADDLLDRALQAALAQPVPQDVRERVIETAFAWRQDSTVLCPPQVGRSSLPARTMSGHSRAARTVRAALSRFCGRRRLGLAGVIAFVAAVAAVLWLSHPNESWSQVADALRKKPWCLAKYTTPNGEFHEAWISFTSDVSAQRDGNFTRFSDHRLNVAYQYDSKERTLTRSLEPEDGGKKGADRWFEKVFQQITGGAEKLDVATPGVEVVEEKQGLVAKYGRTWRSYELAIRPVDAHNAASKPVERLTFLVDPETRQERLPRYLMLSEPSMNPPSIEMALSYPETGPSDIYDLGVPRDAKLVDLVPANDLRRILSKIKSAAERFEKHLALNVSSDAGSPWFVGTLFVLWQRGTSYRSVFGLVDAASAPPKTPPSDADQRRWWKSRWTELFHVANQVCDGSTIWSNEARPVDWHIEQIKPHPLTSSRQAWPQPKWTSRPVRHPWPADSPPLFVAYPYNLVNFLALNWEPVLDLHPADGPVNTVKVILRSGVPDSSSGEERYWIDTQRSYMVVRHESVTRDAPKAPPVEAINLSEVVETADRSPNGIWYPTRIRHIHVIEPTGKKQTIETVTRHYLNFDVRLSDDLFKPIDRPGEPLE